MVATWQRINNGQVGLYSGGRWVHFTPVVTSQRYDSIISPCRSDGARNNPVIAMLCLSLCGAIGGSCDLSIRSTTSKGLPVLRHWIPPDMCVTTRSVTHQQQPDDERHHGGDHTLCCSGKSQIRFPARWLDQSSGMKEHDFHPYRQVYHYMPKMDIFPLGGGSG